MSDLIDRAARALAAADGHEWQDHPGAAISKKQGRYLAKARAVLSLFESEHDRRVTDLLETNNRYLERARVAERKGIAVLAALKSASGYLLNAKIDLETGAPKRTAIQTIEGGLKVVREAIDAAVTDVETK